MSIVNRSSKVVALALAALGGASVVACSSAPSDRSEAETASSDESLTATKPKCQWYESVECSFEGPRGQELCYCMTDSAPYIVEMALGQSTGYALDYGGEIYTWGAGAHYARGDGSLSDVSMLQKPLSLPTISRFPRSYIASHITAGDTGAAAVMNDGSVAAWGTVAPGVDWSTPTTVAGVTADTTQTRQLAHGANHACAINSVDKKTYCWGADDKGQLGDASLVSRTTAAPIPAMGNCQGMTRPIPPLSQIAAGGDTTCGLGLDGLIWCWGDNAHGGLGQGTEGAGAKSATPLCAQAPFDSGSTATWIRGGGAGTFCVGTADPYGDRPLCWGDNDEGQAGAGANGPKDVPTPSTNMLTNAPIQAFGKGFTCTGGATTPTTTESTKCFGDDAFGQLGNAVTSSAPSYSPVAPTFDQFTQIATGGTFACGVPTSGGYLKCWGKDDHGQVPDGEPIPVAPATRVLASPTNADWY